MAGSQHKVSPSKIPSMIWVIGISALLTNFSSIIIFTLTPIYLTQVFGMTTLSLGILEGVVEFTSWSIRVFSGIISDYFQKRKPLLLLAYGMTMLTRPIFAIAPSIGWIYSAKVIDRISNGLQATPREALVGDIAPKEMKGACYGLRQSLGFAGSIIGALAILFLMPYLNNDFREMFWAAAVPSCMALLALVFFVREPTVAPSVKEGKKTHSITNLFKQILHLSPSFWLLIISAGIFMISNYSGAYRILLAKSVGMPTESVSIVMIVQNIGALSGFPLAKLSDRLNRKWLLGFGFLVTILSNLVMGLTHSIPGVIIGSALWGVQMGVTQSVFQAMIADAVPKELRGSGFGIYYLVTAFALFTANAFMGFMFETYGPLIAFMSSSCVAFIALIVVVFPQKQKTSTLQT